MGTVHDGVVGNKGIVFSLGGVEYDGDVKKVSILTEDKDESDLTFAEAAAGDLKDFKVGVTANNSTQAGSLWLHLWNAPGGEEACIYGPHGNAIPTADKPHFLMTVKATGKPPIEQEAKATKERSTFDYEFEVTVAPVLDDGS